MVGIVSIGMPWACLLGFGFRPGGKRATFAVMFIYDWPVLDSSQLSFRNRCDPSLLPYPDVLRRRIRTMPAFVADYFGSTNVGSIYGLMLTPGDLQVLRAAPNRHCASKWTMYRDA